MKNTVITIILIFITQLSGIAQNCDFKIYGLNQDSNIAYLGVHNYIEFDRLFDTISKEFQTTNGVIFSDEYGYKYKPSFIGKSIVKLFHIVNSKKIFIDSCEINVEYLPFTLEIGNHTTYFNDTIEMKKSELLDSPFGVQSTNTNLSAFAKILEFELVIERDNEMIFISKYYNYDRNIYMKIKNNLQMILSNDRVYINHLRYSYGNNYECEHRNIVIKIK